MRVLVTGATGFVGHAVADLYLERGDEVRCLVRSPARAEDLRQLGAEIVVGDVGREEGLEVAVRGVDRIAHVAGVVRAWRRDVYFRTNEQGACRLAKAARAAGVSRFLYVSSLGAVGPAPPGGEVTESSPPRPVNAYGESKLAGERAVAEAAGKAGEVAGMPWVVVRPAIVYGPRDRDVLALFRLIERGLAGYLAPRGARLSWIYVRDLAELIRLVLEEAPAGGVYLATDGTPHTWPDVISAIEKALGRRALRLRMPPRLLWPVALLAQCLRPFRTRPPLLCFSKLREAREGSWVGSSDKARAELGWTPRHGLEEGIRLTAEWYRATGWLHGPGGAR